MFLIPFVGTIYRPYASTSENINLLSGIYFCGVFIFNLVGFSLIVINRWLKKSSLFFIKKRNKLIINCILIAAILFFMNYATLTICKVLLELPFPFVLSSPGLRLIMIIWLVEIVIVSLSITSAFYRQLVILHEKTTKLEESSIKAQYTALQNQLNPHFLFNSLNTLISEIEYNPENAVVFTQKLSDVYRYILKSQEQGLVTLRDELEFLDSYIYLHQVRLGKCIQLENKMPPTLLNKKIPSLTLQLLIENVIKHNIINMENPMVIHLDYSDKDQTLSVRNKIKLKKDVAKSGMGLKNLSARYLLICNLHITIIDDSEYFTVKIPLLNE